MSLPPLTDLVACPHCDTLHHARLLNAGESASCRRCGAGLMKSRPQALAGILSLALTASVLMVVAISFPFLDLNVQGRQHATSVLGAVMAFQNGFAFPLALAIAGFIVILPLTRLLALIYAIAPLVRGARPRKFAREAFGLAETLRPWSMAEIFMVGVTVALIKVSGLATVHFGPAFWALAGLVIITVLKDQLICRYSIWEALDQQQS